MKTIPPEPKPGERYAQRGRGGKWSVWDCEANLVGDFLDESDALLLVYGGELLAACREVRRQATELLAATKLSSAGSVRAAVASTLRNLVKPALAHFHQQEQP